VKEILKVKEIKMAFTEMTLEGAKKIAAEAKTAWDAAKTRDEGAKVIADFGVKIGYKPLIKILIKGVDPDTALAVYGRTK
jgi:hypothetical protein